MFKVDFEFCKAVLELLEWEGEFQQKHYNAVQLMLNHRKLQNNMSIKILRQHIVGKLSYRTIAVPLRMTPDEVRFCIKKEKKKLNNNIYREWITNGIEEGSITSDKLLDKVAKVSEFKLKFEPDLRIMKEEPITTLFLPTDTISFLQNNEIYTIGDLLHIIENDRTSWNNHVAKIGIGKATEIEEALSDLGILSRPVFVYTKDWVAANSGIDILIVENRVKRAFNEMRVKTLAELAEYITREPISWYKRFNGLGPKSAKKVESELIRNGISICRQF